MNSPNSQLDKTTQPSTIRRLYNWFVAWAEKPQAEKALAGFSFAESSFFPIPPDPLLIAMVFTNSKKYLRYAVITIVASVFGGILGYYIGWALFESVGRWLIETYNLSQSYIDLGIKFNDNAFLAVLAAALTPIPYKIITISAGAFRIAFWPFLLASIIGRSIRFIGVSLLAKYLGQKYRNQIEHYIDLFSILVVILVIIFVIAIN